MRFICCLLFFCLLGIGQAQELKKKLPVDPSLKITTLDNGLKVIIKENKSPAGKVEMYLHVGSGSLDEEDNQQGIAHFLEHMAFNGSKNFPAGSLVKYFESLGLTFGMHQNAFTSFNQTTYILSLPNVKEETLEKGLLCLSDFAYRLDLLETEIDKERGVIEEEERARSSVRQRILYKILPELLPGSRVAERLPIGKMEVIKNAPRETFVDFYKKWYHPENAALIIVGDIKAEDMQKMSIKHFRDWKKKKNVPEHLKSGVSPSTSVSSLVVSDPELTSTSVSLVSILPPGKLETKMDYRRSLISNIGDWIMNRRFSKLVKEGKAEFQNAYASQSDFLNVCTYVSANAEGKAENWKKMIAQLTIELKRARIHGFHEQEMDDAIKTIFAGAERAVSTEATRKSKSIVSVINSEITAGRMPMSAKQEFDLITELMPGITLTEINEHFRKIYRKQNRLVLLEIPDKVGLKKPSKEDILQVVNDTEKEEVKALTFKARAKKLLTNEPVPGKITSTDYHEATKVTTHHFENGLVCHHKHMDFNKDNITVVLNFAGGKIEETAENHGISDLSVIPLRTPATHKLSSVDIQNIMTGKNVSVSGSAGEDKISMRISGSRKDLEEGLKLAYILLLDAKIENAVFNLVKQQLSQSLMQYKSSVDMQLMNNLNQSLTGNDPRFSMLDAKHLEKLKIEDAQIWLERILKNAPIEASVVGDIQEKDATELINKYFGSLPKRSKFEHLAALRNIAVKKEPVDMEIKVDTKTPKSLVLVGWRGPEYTDKKDRQCMILAAKILSSRLHEDIREKKQLTYSAFAQSMITPAYKNKSLLFAYFTADKTKARNAADLCYQIVVNFKKDGPTKAETSTVLKQIQTDIKAMIEKPGYWSAYLSDLKMYGKNLNDVAKIQETYSSYTREDIHDVLKKYVVREGGLRIICVPK